MKRKRTVIDSDNLAKRHDVAIKRMKYGQGKYLEFELRKRGLHLTKLTKEQTQELLIEFRNKGSLGAAMILKDKLDKFQ